MKIDNIPKEELEKQCVDLVSRTLIELRQTMEPQEIVIFATSLANDCKKYFRNLHIEDIDEAMSNGVVKTDLYFSRKTYYKWIMTHRDLIWKNTGTEKTTIPLELKYRNRIGTGMKHISNIKQIK
jgi:hypothetical protein